MSKKDQLNESEIIRHAHEWLNDHGQPSYSHLKKIAREGTNQSRDELEELAERYNIQYSNSTTIQELVDKIRLYMNLGPDSA